jgi:hypothetical protein
MFKLFSCEVCRQEIVEEEFVLPDPGKAVYFHKHHFNCELCS